MSNYAGIMLSAGVCPKEGLPTRAVSIPHAAASLAKQNTD